MKKFYSLASAAIVAIAATTGATAAEKLSINTLSQATPATLCPIGDLTKAAPQEVVAAKSKSIAAYDLDNQKSAINLKKANVKAAPTPSEDEWTYLGDATYTDGILYAAYNASSGSTYSVPVYQSVTNEDIYMLSDVYPASSFIYGKYSIIDENAASTLILDKSNGDDKVLASYTFNCTDGDVLTVSQQYYGSFTGEAFKFGEQDFIVSYSGTPYAYSTEIRILLPGAKDYALSLTPGDFCGADNKISFGIAVGDDVTGIKFADFNGTADPSNAAYVNAVVTQGGTIPQAGNYNYTLGKAGWHTLMFVTLDVDGAAAECKAVYYYAQSHNAEDWIDLGEATYNDDTFIKLYGVNSAVPAYKVNILESKTVAGLYRIVDPMANNPYYSQFGRKHADHTHYLDINAADAENVSIALQPLGAGMSDTDWAIRNINAGTVTSNKISFPVKGLIVCDYSLSGYYANQLGNFGLEIPYHVCISATDAESNAIANAWVYVGDKEYQADENGMVDFGLTSQETTTITIYADGYDPFEYTIEPGLDHTVEIAAILEQAKASLTISVIDEEYEPVADAWVYVGADEYQTNENGRVVIEFPGSVFGTKIPVSIYKDGYEYWEGEADFTETLEAYVTATLEQAKASLTISVIDEEYEPVADAWVYVGADEYQTNENGRVVIEFPGSVFGTKIPVSIYKDGYEYWEGEADFTETLEAYVTATLETAICTATIHVVDEDLEPIENAKIEIEDHDNTYVTGENGRVNVSLKGSFGRAHKITITHDKYETYEGNIEFFEQTDAYHTATMTAKAEDGVNAIEADEAANETYNLNGIRVKNPANGIYIVNGAKVLIKK